MNNTNPGLMVNNVWITSEKWMKSVQHCVGKFPNQGASEERDVQGMSGEITGRACVQNVRLECWKG